MTTPNDTESGLPPADLPAISAGRAGEAGFGNAGLSFHSVEEALRVAQALVRDGFTPEGLKAAGVLMVMDAAQRFNVPFVTAFRLMPYIEKKVTIMGELSLAIVRARGVCRPDGHPMPEWTGEGKAARCVVTAHRNDSSLPIQADFTMAEADRMNLLGKPNWRRDPKMMLFWRAWGRLARMNFGDVLLGIPIAEEARDWNLDSERQRHRPLKEATVVSSDEPMAAGAGYSPLLADRVTQDAEVVPVTPVVPASPVAVEAEQAEPEPEMRDVAATECAHRDGFAASSDSPTPFCIHCGEVDPSYTEAADGD